MLPRRTKVPPKKPSARSPEDEALDALIRKSHFRDYQYSLEAVVDCAAAYAAEMILLRTLPYGSARTVAAVGALASTISLIS
jgi:predicted dinucleotide-utilizing enzyme